MGSMINHNPFFSNNGTYIRSYDAHDILEIFTCKVSIIASLLASGIVRGSQIHCSSYESPSIFMDFSLHDVQWDFQDPIK